MFCVRNALRFFQQLLVAPAALGLLAPLAANAAEINIADVDNYSNQTVQATTATQFSDVVPGDWAYKSLLNISNSYGCVNNSYSQNIRNGQALTRYEAAALLNACLDNGLVANREAFGLELTRLTEEFGAEMAILKGQRLGLQSEQNNLNAGTFAPTTVLSGGTVFTAGAVDGATTGEALALQYNFTVDINSSFTGRDNLYAGVETGNAAAPLEMDSATTGAEFLKLASLFYTFPVGDDFTIATGPLLDQDDVIASTGSIYSGSFRLGVLPFSAGGNETGPGAAVSWSNPNGLVASASFISDNGEGSAQGIFTEEGSDVITASVGYDSDKWGVGIVYFGDDAAPTAGTNNGSSSIGAGVYFRPENFATISITYDQKSADDAGTQDSNDFMIGMDYEVGPGTASAAFKSNEDAGAETQSSYEIFYNYPVNDGISIQGGFFHEGQAGAAESHNGVVIETFFTF